MGPASKSPRQQHSEPDDQQAPAKKQRTINELCPQQQHDDDDAQQTDDQQPNVTGEPATPDDGGKAVASAAAAEPAAADRSGELPENAVEQGRLFFLYKPKVTAAGEAPSVASLDDVQRFYIIMQPQQPEGGPARLIIVGKKRLPDAAKHERFYSFVGAVASAAELTAGMTEQHYSTKTRGERVQPAARAVGEAPYVIATGGSRGGSHLAYRLDIPLQPGEAQAVLGIKQEGSFALSAKNPDNRGQRNAPAAGPVPEYTLEQKSQFAGRAWISVTDRSLLDVVGTELLLVGARDDPIETGELGEGGELLEQLSEEERSELGDDEAQQEQLLKKQLEPEGGDSGDEPIPIGPAVTGNLS